MGKMQRISYKGQELLPAKMDIVLKAILTSDGDFELLASLLSCVLNLDIDADDVTVTNTELSPGHEEGKLARIDVRVRLRDGKHCNVEVQLNDEHNIAKRSIYYLSRLYVDQMKPAMRFTDICPTIAINILDFPFLPFEEYHNVYRLKNVRNNHELTDAYEINFVELEKVPADSHAGLKDWWMLFLAADSEEMLDMLAGKDPIMEKAVKKLQYVSSDEQLRFLMDMRMKAELDYGSAMAENYVRGEAIGLEKGEAIGLEKGEAIGLEKGEAIGLERGEAIGLEKGEAIGRLLVTTELARKLRATATMSDDEIAKLCGMSLEEVENL